MSAPPPPPLGPTGAPGAPGPPGPPGAPGAPGAPGGTKIFYRNPTTESTTGTTTVEKKEKRVEGGELGFTELPGGLKRLQGNKEKTSTYDITMEDIYIMAYQFLKKNNYVCDIDLCKNKFWPKYAAETNQNLHKKILDIKEACKKKAQKFGPPPSSPDDDPKKTDEDAYRKYYDKNKSKAGQTFRITPTFRDYYREDGKEVKIKERLENGDVFFTIPFITRMLIRDIHNGLSNDDRKCDSSLSSLDRKILVLLTVYNKLKNEHDLYWFKQENNNQQSTSEEDKKKIIKSRILQEIRYEKTAQQYFNQTYTDSKYVEKNVSADLVFTASADIGRGVKKRLKDMISLLDMVSNRCTYYPREPMPEQTAKTEQNQRLARIRLVTEPEEDDNNDDDDSDWAVSTVVSMGQKMPNQVVCKCLPEKKYDNMYTIKKKERDRKAGYNLSTIENEIEDKKRNYTIAQSKFEKDVEIQKTEKATQFQTTIEKYPITRRSSRTPAINGVHVQRNAESSGGGFWAYISENHHKTFYEYIQFFYYSKLDNSTYRYIDISKNLNLGDEVVLIQDQESREILRYKDGKISQTEEGAGTPEENTTDSKKVSLILEHHMRKGRFYLPPVLIPPYPGYESADTQETLLLERCMAHAMYLYGKVLDSTDNNGGMIWWIDRFEKIPVSPGRDYEKHEGDIETMRKQKYAVRTHTLYSGKVTVTGYKKGFFSEVFFIDIGKELTQRVNSIPTLLNDVANHDVATFLRLFMMFFAIYYSDLSKKDDPGIMITQLKDGRGENEKEDFYTIVVSRGMPGGGSSVFKNVV